jgi:hypothetical protein
MAKTTEYTLHLQEEYSAEESVVLDAINLVGLEPRELARLMRDECIKWIRPCYRREVLRDQEAITIRIYWWLVSEDHISIASDAVDVKLSPSDYLRRFGSFDGRERYD